MTTTLTRSGAPRRTRTYVPTGEVGQILAEARALQLQIQELTAKYDAKRAWLLQHMQRNKLTHVQLGPVRCTLKERARWSYSPETERDMQALQVTQKWEQSRGIATNSPMYYTAISEATE